MTKAKLFINGRSQAVRLPKECRFGGKEVAVVKFGEIVVLYPPDKRWKLLEESLQDFSDDFMKTRDQPKRQQRRRGL
ncbi:MAG TPA: antitoxin [Tepidisphaeraceae bacterium]|jgi:antitoxin VapB|nr:antitoxin [Tepidisphaeraceae bacterium]